MLYRFVASTRRGHDSDSDDSFSAPSIANSIASTMTGKLDEQFSGLQALLSGLNGSTLKDLATSLQAVVDLTEDDSLTPKDLKRALVGLTRSIGTVTRSVGAIEASLSEVRKTNDSVTDVLVSFEGYIIANGSFLKKVDQRLAGCDIEAAEDAGDDFDSTLREMGENVGDEDPSTYVEALNEACVDLQDSIARRLGLAPLLSNDDAGEGSNGLKMEDLDRLEAGAGDRVAVRDGSRGSFDEAGDYSGELVDGVIGSVEEEHVYPVNDDEFSYRREFNDIRNAAHSELSGSLETLREAISFPYTANFKDFQENLTSRLEGYQQTLRALQLRKSSECESGPEVEKEAVKSVSTALDAELVTVQIILTELAGAMHKAGSSNTAPARLLNPLLGKLSVFVVSTEDENVGRNLDAMLAKLNTFDAFFKTPGASLPVRLLDIRDYLLRLDAPLKITEGERCAKPTIDHIRGFLMKLHGTKNLTHYQMINAMNDQFERGFSAASEPTSKTPAKKK